MRIGRPCACILFQRYDAHFIRNAPLDRRVGFIWKHQRNIGKRQRNITSLRRNAIAWLSKPRQMGNARFWKKWLRLGGGWLRRRITSVSSQPIVFRQPRLRVLLPNETILAPCVAAKPALARLRRCALSLGTLELSADTVPTLARRNTLPTLTQRESAIGVPYLLTKKEPQATYALGVLCCLTVRLISRAAGRVVPNTRSRA
jgi:hypothetical protein